MALDETFEIQFQLPPGVERSTNLDEKAAAVIDAYRVFAAAAGREVMSQLWYGEFSSTQESTLVLERN
ncbi:hypothetical protein ACWD3J_15335 [Streptomyces sp. NPDC002755]